MIDIINIGVNYIIEMVAAWQYFRSFYSSKCSKQTECMFMVSAYVMMFCLFWLQIFWFNAVDFLIINCFLCFYLFSRRISSSVFHAIQFPMLLYLLAVVYFIIWLYELLLRFLLRRKRDWKPKAVLQFYWVSLHWCLFGLLL